MKRFRGAARGAPWLAFALALGACATAPPPGPAPLDTGLLFLWEVESDHPGGGLAHLLGSVHVARTDLRLDPAVDAAFSDAEALVVEVDLREISLEESTALRVELGQLPDGQTLDRVLPPETWEEFVALLERHGQSPDSYRVFEPWVAMVSASALLAAEEKLSGEAGVDRMFLERAGDREVIALETLASQVALFDELPIDQQAHMLGAVVAESEVSADTIGLRYEAWSLGDARTLEALVHGATGGDPELVTLHQRMFVQRNHSMAERIDGLLRNERSYFVVIGAGHLVGAGGIPALLSDRGHRVRRLERTAAP